MNKEKFELLPGTQVVGFKCKEVTAGRAEEIIAVDFPKMVELIREINKGVKDDGYICMGLAAPQVGIKEKWFVKVNYTKEGDKPTRAEYSIFFNSKYTGAGSRTKSEEGCFSHNYGKDRNVVKRYKRIMLSTAILDRENKELFYTRKSIKGKDAIVFQHEIDHHGNFADGLSKTIFLRRFP